MKLITSRDLAKAANLNIPGRMIIAGLLMRILSINKINKLYTSSFSKNPLKLITSALEHLNITYDLPSEDIENIPASGPCIIVSNHPYGGVDALILMKLLFTRRPDFKAMANFLLQKITPFKDYVLPVNPFETKKDIKTSYSGLKEGLNHIRNGHCVMIFPAGEVSTMQGDTNNIMDREWQIAAIKFIKKAAVPIVPVYFYGNNSVWFHLLGRIHPILRTAKLPSELLNKKKSKIKLRIGKPLSVTEQSQFTDIEKFGRYLRARTYALSTTTEVRKFFKRFRKRRIQNPMPVEKPVDQHVLSKEIENIRKEYELFSLMNYSVFFVPADQIPNVILEIGRLREITFRAAGEGTNRNIDLDEFDLYFNHLIVWDNSEYKIVGAYRIGKGDEILNMYGIRGFYISTLFKLSPSFEKYLDQSLELGRSFIVEEYQKKPLSLLLLWKGIITILMLNSHYRYLIGPVSMSSQFSQFSKSLVVEFFRLNYSDARLRRLIKPRNRFVIKRKDMKLVKALMESSDNDILKIEKVINTIDSGTKIPVLYKKYIDLNARMLGFNIDPDFNNCLDTLMLLDVANIPAEFIQTLLKDKPDKSMLKVFSSR